MKKFFVVFIVLVAFGIGGATLLQKKEIAKRIVPQLLSSDLQLISQPKTASDRIVNGAKKQVIDHVYYDASYATISYPGGDVPQDRGACTDVIIRALRNAGYDLQKLIHEDMSRNFRIYPHKWGLSHPDKNIDHRRIPNHLVFMKRFGTELTKSTAKSAASSWKPGDLIYWDYGNGLTHCGVISNDVGPRGLPMVIHNNGPWASQEDILDKWPVLGHFKYPKS